MNHLYSVDVYKVTRRNGNEFNLLFFYRKNYSYSKVFEKTETKIALLKDRFYKNKENIGIEKILENEVETDDIERDIQKYMNSNEDKFFDNSYYLYGVAKINQLYCKIDK